MEEKISDTLQNDNMSPEEVQKKLSHLLEKYEQLSDEEKKEFHKDAFDIVTKSLHKLSGNTILPAWLAVYQSYILFILAMSIVIFLFVVVTRKLYQRMKERENRKVKKKLKEHKKIMKKNKQK